ncbi:hypothetical protein F5Y06DRAFT_29815 [Hypoxylon sp. FL0890]|nr:hypothetical protein F5Y06DRAFT_29815 [Hypoxylon sp. FL0890]
MKFTKCIVALLPSCLWHTANAVPVPILNMSSSSQPELPSFPYRIGSTTYTHQNRDLTRATILKPIARAAGVSTNASSLLSNHTSLPGSSPRNITLTTYCRSNSSTFVNATVADSPPASDCAAIADSLIPQLGARFFHYDAADLAQRNTTGIKQLQKYGACAFGVVAGDMRSDSVRIGTGDVVNVIRESIRRFASGIGNANARNRTVAEMKVVNATAGRLDVAGAFECGGSVTMVNWALYRA